MHEGNNFWNLLLGRQQDFGFCCWKATNVGNLVAGRQQTPIPTDSKRLIFNSGLNLISG